MGLDCGARMKLWYILCSIFKGTWELLGPVSFWSSHQFELLRTHVGTGTMTVQMETREYI